MRESGNVAAVGLRASTHIPAAAIALILAAVLCFASLDGIVKALTPRYPVALLVWTRYSVQALAILIWVGHSMRFRLVRTSRLRLQVARALILLVSSVLFVRAL